MPRGPIAFALAGLSITGLSLAGLVLPGCVGGPAPDPVTGLRPAVADDDRPAPDDRRIVPEVGYDDTPKLPGSRYRVHDGHRPQPRVVRFPAGTELPPRPAPSDATVLFDGTTLDRWTGGGGTARWKLDGGFMEVNGTGDIRTRDSFGDVQLHLEFRTPDAISGKSQGRGNSGVFFLDGYEVQILDSYENPTYPDGQAGALYGQRPPLVNASLPPGTWQHYDIVFTAPRYDDAGGIAEPARVTVLHNGVLVQRDVEFLGPTRHRALTEYVARPEFAGRASEGPIRLQDHGNPMRFRNIWVRALDSDDGRSGDGESADGDE